MVPSDSALATSYRLSVVTMCPSAAVWPQFSKWPYLSGHILDTVKITDKQCSGLS